LVRVLDIHERNANNLPGAGGIGRTEVGTETVSGEALADIVASNLRVRNATYEMRGVVELTGSNTRQLHRD
jgi:hypothetical protein